MSFAGRPPCYFREEELEIAELTRRIYEQGASVKDILHERAWLFSSVDQVRVKVVLETLGKAHNERILAALRRAGRCHRGLHRDRRQ